MPDEMWLICVGLCIAIGCHQSSVPNNDTDNQEEVPASECEIDGDCEGYYRCIDEECSVPPAMSGERDDETPIVRLYDEEGDELAMFYLEMAITLEEQARGLMYRPTMLDEWGMLFVYAHEQQLSFWMKNTLISLDMIFIDAEGVVVGVVEEAEPETETPRGVGQPARYVLEINGGLAAEHGIERGTTMSLEHVDERYQPSR